MMTAEKPTLYPVKDDELPIVKDISANYLTGYISLFRSIREHWIWNDPRKFQWWVDILMECNHADRKVTIGFELIECRRGQTLHSLLDWSKRWRVDISTVRRFLRMLSQDGMIVHEPLSKTTRLTVCNYDSYQQERQDKDTRRKRDANATQTQDNTNNNGNNDNNVNKVGSAAAAADRPKSFKQWTEPDLVASVAEFKEVYDRDMLNAFYKYWSEKAATGKMRFQLEKTWETKKRLETWYRRQMEKK